MSMIVVSGFDAEPEQQAFECLRCGFVQEPTSKPREASREDRLLGIMKRDR
jgi:hypothetical protein